MDLVDALEKLSLQVRSNNNHISQESGLQWHHPEAKINNYQTTTTTSTTTNNTSCENQNYSLHGGPQHSVNFRQQLNDLDSSIETLFSQLSELEQPRQRKIQGEVGKLGTFVDQFSDTDMVDCQVTCQDKNSHNLQAKPILGGHQFSDYSQTIVDQLIKHDPNTITNIVKKWSELLSLGQQMERIYNGHFCGHYHSDKVTIDVSKCRQICDEYMNLCWREPWVCDMPTIMRYSEYHGLLIAKLNEIYASSPRSTA